MPGDPVRGLSHAPLFVLGATVAALLTAMPSASQTQPEPTDPMARHAGFIRAIQRAAAEVTAAGIPGGDSLESWNRRRPEVREKLLSMLGLSPLPKRTPLRARVTGVVARDGYRIEKLVLQSSPGLYVTANLYLPDGPGRRPTILYLCGHSPHPAGAKWDYQDRALWFVRRGYVCLVLDTLEFGEVPGLHHGLHDLNMWHWLSLGYTPAGVEVWNGIRALDYLETRSEVDPARIGVTGISGGGAMSWYLAAVDDRIAVSGPVCGTITYGSQAAHWRAWGQCDCIYYPNPYRLDFTAAAALIAPRPLLICSGRQDPDFPPDGYHGVYEAARRHYRLYGCEERVREVDAAVGHTDAPLFRQEVRAWMNRWLKQDPAPVELLPVEAKPEPPETLTCLADLPRDAINHRIHDSFVPVARARMPASRQAWSERREVLLEGLRERVFGWFPKRDPFRARRGAFTGAWGERYADFEELFFDSEPDVTLRVQLLRARKRVPGMRTLLYVKRAGDSIWPVDYDELLALLGRVDVAILNPRFTERDLTARERADIEVSSSWSGRTIASQQVWDILRCVGWLREERRLPVDDLALYGKGETGMLGLYAGLLEPSIRQVILDEPPASHRQGPALLHVLRVTDVPEAAAAFAPGKLTFVRRIPPRFDLTRKAYRLLGGSLGTAPSLPDAVGLFGGTRRAPG
jgi:dienelactone hydrolase